MELSTLKALYIDGLRDLHSSESQIIKALPRMEAGANSPELKAAFGYHLEQSKEHLARLERICADLGVSPDGKHCKGMEGLIDECAELLKEDAAPDVKDAGLIAAQQHVEHYEMAGYGTARTYAHLLGYDDQATLLQATLLDERGTDINLTDLAMMVNVDAIVGDTRN